MAADQENTDKYLPLAYAYFKFAYASKNVGYMKKSLAIYREIAKDNLNIKDAIGLIENWLTNMENSPS